MDSGTRDGTPADELARLSNSGTEENPTSAQPAPTPRAEQAAGAPAASSASAAAANPGNVGNSNGANAAAGGQGQQNPPSAPGNNKVTGQQMAATGSGECV